MRRILKLPKVALFSFAALALFTVLVYTVPTRVLVPVMDGLLLGVAGSVTIVFSPLFVRAVTSRKFDRVNQITIGIALTWLSLVGSRFVNMWLLSTGDPGQRSFLMPVVGVLTYLATCGGVLHITAAGMEGDEWRHNRRTLAAGILIGCAIAAAVIGFRLLPY